MDPIYDLFTRLGMGTPTMRFVGVSLITGAVLWIAKPKLMFDPKTGQPRSWSLLDSKDPSTVTTPLPWYVASAGVGGIAAVVL